MVNGFGLFVSVVVSVAKPSFFLFQKQHAAAVIGNKMIVVGGESGSELLDDVQVG